MSPAMVGRPDTGDGRASIFASRSHEGDPLVAILLDLDPAVCLEAGTFGRLGAHRRFIQAAGSPGIVGATPPGDDLSALLPPCSITILDLHLANGS